jgi:hypothetical protein
MRWGIARTGVPATADRLVPLQPEIRAGRVRRDYARDDFERVPGDPLVI